MSINKKIIIILSVIIGIAIILSTIYLLSRSLSESIAPPSSNLPSITHYGAKVGDSGANLVGFDLTIYNPTSDKTYSNTLPLNFSIHWIYGLFCANNSQLYGEYTYQLDSSQSVSLPTIQKTNYARDFIFDPSFSKNIDISGLPNGEHSLTITTDLKWDPFGDEPESAMHQTSEPIQFLIKR
jgi:hypothetical protein